MITHSMRTRYKMACKMNEVMNMVAEILTVKVRINNQARNTPAAPAAKFNNRI